MREYYAQAPQSLAWESRKLPERRADIGAVADLLAAQNRRWGAGDKTLENIAKLKAGARAVVTGQQVSLFGGPLYSLLKAATAVKLAEEASQRGVPHVPVFWLATEDHDFAEVNAASFPEKISNSDKSGAEHRVATLHLCDTPKSPVPVGGWVPGDCMEEPLAQVAALLGDSWATDLLREAYAPGTSLADSFARLYVKLFAAHGLIVMDASGRDFHALARPVLAQALRESSQLHDALVARSEALVAAGFHAQVLVSEYSSLLFLTDAGNGARTALKRAGDGEFVIPGRRLSVTEVERILQETPERVSANALLRPVMQDYLLPTAAYVGGPAEIAYFAQSAVLYQAILGGVTPVLPRLSATLVERGVQRLLERHELSVRQTWTTTEDLALRLGARAMPVEAKKRLAAAGDAAGKELAALLEYAAGVDAGLAHSAEIAANKIRYQRERLRRLMAKFELERDATLEHHAEALTTNLYPAGVLQERKLAGIYFAARQGPELIDRLVAEAADRCPGHKVIVL
jgi:bacillithiol biosynthesis cysteine-adding enzyme BshC